MHGPAGLYISLLKNLLLGLTFSENELSIVPSFRQERHIKPLDLELRLEGRDWPVIGLTMTGMSRLGFIEDAFEAVNRENVPGDFVECGVWKGGSSIFAAALNRVSGIPRNIWLFDSFQGFPETQFRQDFEAGLDDQWRTQQDVVRISQETVQNNFRALNLLPNNNHSNIRMVKGYFEESIPAHGKKIGKIGILRLDGDMYASTMVILHGFYGQISIGGFVIVDDWNIAACREAIHSFRNSAGIKEPLQMIDNSSVYWIKKQEAASGVSIENWKENSEASSNHRFLVGLFRALIAVGPGLIYIAAFVHALSADRAYFEELE